MGTTWYYLIGIRHGGVYGLVLGGGLPTLYQVRLDIQNHPDIPPQVNAILGMFSGSSHTEPQFWWPWMSKVPPFFGRDSSHNDF